MIDPVVLARGKFWRIIRRGVYIAYCKSFTVEKFREPIGKIAKLFQLTNLCSRLSLVLPDR